MNAPGVIFQTYHWYVKSSDNLWQKLSQRASDLAGAGFTALWLPPAYKGNAGTNDVGYGTYDLYDLGEFDQKGAVPTKYGTREALLAAIESAHGHGLDVYADIVLNHKAGADDYEEIRATRINPANRLETLGQETILAPTVFTFPGRSGTHSSFTWNHSHFDAVDHDKNKPEEAGKTIYLLDGKSFDQEVDGENANYDYLMFADLDMENPEVREELNRWGEWFVRTTKADGFRFDAVKHIQSGFLKQWIGHMRQANADRELFSVGEYWHMNVEPLLNYISRTEGCLSLFDVPLHYRFREASTANGNFDMKTLLSGTLVEKDPLHAVTFVDNHDTQPGQALESFVEPWFKPLAYAVILLRQQGYPCVFALDYDGGSYREGDRQIDVAPQRETINRLLEVRRKFAHGEQKDYFDHHDVVGWTRLGESERPKALAVLLSDGADGFKDMFTGRKNARFRDVTENISETVTTGEDGVGRFTVKGRSLSVWVEE